MKYIIEIPDVAVASMDGDMIFSVEPKDNSWEGMHYVLRIDEEDVSIYTEPDRKAIEDEVWEFVRELIHCNNGKGMTDDELQSCFGYDLYSQVFKQLSYQDVKAKYDEWKELKEDEAIMKEVTALAEKIGIHKLYSMVKEIRGE